MPIKNTARGNFDYNSVEFKREIMLGICKFIPKVLNPTNEEYAQIFGHVRNKNAEPQYITDITKSDGKPGKRIRLDFCGYLYAFSDTKLEGQCVEYTMTYFIENSPRVSREGKRQYIDVYGNTTWDMDGKFTELKNDRFDTSKCRVAFQGEENLIKFLSKFNGVNSQYVKSPTSNEYIKNPNISDSSECEIYFDNDEVSKLFTSKYKDVLSNFIDYPISKGSRVVILTGVREYVDKESGAIKRASTFYKNKIFSGKVFSLQSTIGYFNNDLVKNKSEKEYYDVVDGYITTPDEEPTNTENTYNTKESIPEINVSDISNINEISEIGENFDEDLPF